MSELKLRPPNPDQGDLPGEVVSGGAADFSGAISCEGAPETSATIFAVLDLLVAQ